MFRVNVPPSIIIIMLRIFGKGLLQPSNDGRGEDATGRDARVADAPKGHCFVMLI